MAGPATITGHGDRAGSLAARRPTFGDTLKSDNLVADTASTLPRSFRDRQQGERGSRQQPTKDET